MRKAKEEYKLDRVLTYLGITVSIVLSIVTIRPAFRVFGWFFVFAFLAHPVWHTAWWIYGRKAKRWFHILIGCVLEALLFLLVSSLAAALWPVEVSMIFKASPKFTWLERKKITFAADSYRNYLVGIGYDAPRRFPPLGVSPGLILTGGAWNGGYYSQTAIMSQEGFPDHVPEQLRFVYGMDFFMFAFPESPKHEEGWSMAQSVARIYTDFYRCSYVGTPQEPWSGPNEIKEWEVLLWKVRDDYGQEFTDSLLFMLSSSGRHMGVWSMTTASIRTSHNGLKLVFSC